jgi:hypothetical protein
LISKLTITNAKFCVSAANMKVGQMFTPFAVEKMGMSNADLKNVHVENITRTVA